MQSARFDLSWSSDRLEAWVARCQSLPAEGVRSNTVAGKIALHLETTVPSRRKPRPSRTPHALLDLSVSGLGKLEGVGDSRRSFPVVHLQHQQVVGTGLVGL